MSTTGTDISISTDNESRSNAQSTNIDQLRMATKRRLSAPAAPSSSPPCITTSTPDGTPGNSSSPSSSSNTTPINAKLLERAEKLTRMTTELRIHKVIMQANDLARSLEELTRRTECNDSFRHQNQERMEKVWFDILNVKANLEKHLEKSAEDSFDMKAYHKEVMDVKSSMGQVRALVQEVVGKVSQLPTLAEANALLAGVNAHREACEAAVATCRERTTCAGMRPEVPRKSVHTRIRETIRSTRRWHHDHKTTPLPDRVFTANYLKKQSKRDPDMAVYIQRAIHRRIKRRRRESVSQPHSLEEFCQDVEWEDVTKTVEEVLVNKLEYTVRSLSQSSQSSQ